MMNPSTLFKRVCAIVLTVVIGASVLSAFPISASTYTKTERPFDENIMISIFWPPTPEYINDEQYKLMADAGITMVQGAGEESLATEENQKKMIELCKKYGMGLIIQDGSFGSSVSSKTSEELTAAVSKYKDEPTVQGYYMVDEPMNANQYINAYAAIKRTDPDAYVHLNFFPSNVYASNDEYKAQLNDYARLAAATGYPLDYLIYDRYPFGLEPGSIDRNGFYSNLRAVYEVGLKNDVKTGLYIQTVGTEGGKRRPTADEIRFEMYTALAYGYKQLSFFTWFTPTNRTGEPFIDGIISPTGVPNEHYEPIKKINHEILAIGPTLVKCDALGVYLSGMAGYGEPSIPNDMFAQARTSNGQIVLSWMKHKETGRNYLMAVNQNFNARNEVTLTFDEEITSISEVSRNDGSLLPLSLESNKLNFTLEAGDGILLALPEEFDYHTAPSEQPQKSEDLAKDALISAPSSLGEDGWYISYLNDGVLKSTDENRGWRSVGESASHIVIDLGREIDFNRLDLYPAVSKFDYGASFPDEVIVSVSNDGVSYKDIGIYSGLQKELSGGKILQLNNQNARYIRIGIPKINGSVGYTALAEIAVYNDDGSLPKPETYDIYDFGEQITYRTGENIALGKDAICSSTTNDLVYKRWGFSLSFINDGKYDNGYSSNVKLNRTEDATEYVTIHFGDLFAVDTIKVIPFHCWPLDFKLELSTDGSNWTTVYEAEASEPSSDGLTVVLDSPVPARMVRLIATKLRYAGGDGYLLQLGEIEAYGKPICDRTMLEAAMAEFEARGGLTTRYVYVRAKNAIANANLTQTSADAILKELQAEIDDLPPIQTDTEPESTLGTTTDQTSAPDTEDEVESNPTSGNNGCSCASQASLSFITLISLGIFFKKRK